MKINFRYGFFGVFAFMTLSIIYFAASELYTDVQIEQSISSHSEHSTAIVKTMVDNINKNSGSDTLHQYAKNNKECLENYLKGQKLSYDDICRHAREVIARSLNFGNPYSYENFDTSLFLILDPSLKNPTQRRMKSSTTPMIY